eukprot:TRINITY_DN8222_c0_g1_i1.p1 TRINITY_DN8222_c0_g1~~TRINITY_DN8222_c0_g1_i1.p1  ORF type:complete len:472 (+),score=82.84 TRINITY_DN8222_c0_g1_i1:60-1475(+)
MPLLHRSTAVIVAAVVVFSVFHGAAGVRTSSLELEGTSRHDRSSNHDESDSIEALLRSIAFNPEEGTIKNADKAFQQMLMLKRMQNDLTPNEIELFKERFEQEVKNDCDVGKCSRPEQFRKTLRVAMLEQKPILTKKFVDKINSANLTWTARLNPTFVNSSLGDLKFILPPGMLEEKSEQEDHLESDSSATGNSSSFSEKHAEKWFFGGREPVPEEFDAREKWPACAQTMNQARSQGSCGSCWAQAVAKMLSIKGCVEDQETGTGKNNFVSPDAISAEYITSCFSDTFLEKKLLGHRDGCQGGFPKSALSQLRGKPIPNERCVPYTITGNSLFHFTEKTVAPPCPVACTETHPVWHVWKADETKGRPVEEFSTTFNPNPKKVSDLQRAKESLIQHGSVILSYDVHKCFFAYSTGVYEPTDDRVSGRHAVAVTGYKGSVLRATNSWGSHWGDAGSFQIASTCCDMMFTIYSP